MQAISGNAEAFQKGQVVEQPVRDHSTGFDYRVQVKDAKTGRLIRKQDYCKHSRGTEVLLERPIGSGNAFFENGESAGRWDFKLWKKIADEHNAVAPQAASFEEELMQRNEQLEAELAALKAEQKKKG